MKTQETIDKEIQEVTNFLYTKFNGQYRLSKKTAAHLIGISVSSLDRQRYTIGIPFYQNTDTSNIYYDIRDISKFLVTQKVQTA